MLFLITLCLAIVIFMSVFLVFTQDNHFLIIDIVEITDSFCCKTLRCLSSAYLFFIECALIYFKVYAVLDLKLSIY